MAHKKSSTIQKRQRIAEVLDWIINKTVPDYKLVDKICEAYGVGDRQARRYIQEAEKNYLPALDQQSHKKVSMRIDSLWSDIETMNEKSKKTPAGKKVILEIKKEISKLENLYPARKVEISGDPDKPLNVTTTIEAIEIVRISK